jgi:hypothetical protein
MLSEVSETVTTMCTIEEIFRRGWYPEPPEEKP